MWLFSLTLIVFCAFVVSAVDGEHGAALIKPLPESAFSGSTQYPASICYYGKARRTSGHGWCASGNSNPNDYLQIDLGQEYEIESVSTYPRFGARQYVKTYKLSYSLDGASYSDYTETLNGNQQANTGNDDVDEVNNKLDPPIDARYLRFTPITFNDHKSMRVEAYGSDLVSISDNICTFPKCNSNVALDMVFLMDESGSIDIDEWGIMVNFVKRLINLDINDISFVSLIEYGSIETEGSMLEFNQFLDFTESTASNRNSILDALDNNVYTTIGYTYTADAIQRTINIFTDWNKNSDSENIRPDLLFILTDGNSKDTLCPDLQGIVADSGVEIILIGIGSELNADSWSDPFYCLADITRNAFYVSDFADKDFNRIEGDLRDKTCQNTQNSNAMRIPFKYDPNVWSTNTVLNTNTIQIDYKIAIGIIILIGLLCSIIIGLLLCSIGSMQNLKTKTYQNDMQHL